MPVIPDDMENKDHKGEFITEYYATDAKRQLAHEKLPYILASSSQESPSTSDTAEEGQISARLSYLASLQISTFEKASSVMQTIDKTLHGWIRRVQGMELEDWEEDADWEEGTPIEQLSAQQRRRRIKMDIRRLGVVEDGELRSIYRPRKRL